MCIWLTWHDWHTTIICMSCMYVLYACCPQLTHSWCWHRATDCIIWVNLRFVDTLTAVLSLLFDAPLPLPQCVALYVYTSPSDGTSLSTHDVPVTPYHPGVRQTRAFALNRGSSCSETSWGLWFGCLFRLSSLPTYIQQPNHTSLYLSH